MPDSSRPHIVIIGGGFAGLYAARSLARHPVRITVVDRKNHHTFQPLLYQVATAALSPADIASPIRGILRRYRNVEVLLDEALAFDLASRRVKLREVELGYDYLIVAAGATHAYFGHDGWAPFAPGLKTLEDALEIRRRVLLAYEVAERRAASGMPSGPLNFVIVGAGPTGAELAGALAEIAHQALIRDFRHIDPAQARIILLEGGPRILPAYPEDLSQKAGAQLRRLGVEVRTATMVTSVESGAVMIGSERLPSAVTLWAAGVLASPLGKMLGAKTDRAGRVQVEPDLSITGHPQVFVIGDLASILDEKGNPVPGVAPAAIQQGQRAAANIICDLRKKPRSKFVYWDKGSLATIGRAAAIADMPGGIRLSGLIAWLAWLFIHIFFLIGFRNRLLVIIQWAWAYLTFQRGTRLITGNTSMPGVKTQDLL
ncbi:MAG: NAD(P)/FAD-dependent oxidoreductase [Acidobacteria bacterium]|nr:NAD(P)/FAD-dependent oxidoreductase [Acidobacteriota bacterium]